MKNSKQAICLAIFFYVSTCLTAHAEDDCLKILTTPEEILLSKSIQSINYNFLNSEIDAVNREEDVNKLINELNPQNDPEKQNEINTFITIYNRLSASGFAFDILMERIQGRPISAEVYIRIEEIEKLSAAQIEEKIQGEVEAIKPYVEELEKHSIHYVKEIGWDFNQAKLHIDDLNNARLKTALALLISPTFSIQISDPERKEAIWASNAVFLPVEKRGSRTGNIPILTYESYVREVEKEFKKIEIEVSRYLSASKAAGSYWNLMKGSWWRTYHSGRGWLFDVDLEDGVGSDDGGYTPYELEKMAAFENFELLRDNLIQTYGIPDKQRDSLYRLSIALLHEDTQHIKNGISTIKSVELAVWTMPLVAIPFGGAAAIGGALTRGGYIATQVGLRIVPMSKFMFYFPAALGFTFATSSAAVDSWKHGGDFFCRLKEELVRFGAPSLAMSNILGAFPTAFAVTGSGIGLIKGAPIMGVAADGVTTVIISAPGLSLATTSFGLLNIGASAYFISSMGYAGASNLAESSELFKVANIISENKGDSQLVDAFASEGWKRCIEGGVDLSFALMGAGRMTHEGVKAYKGRNAKAYKENSYYKILGVDKNATQAEIKAAYRELARKYHPDQPGGDSAKMAAINEAYEVLSKKSTRKIYDALAQSRSGEVRDIVWLGNGDQAPSSSPKSPDISLVPGQTYATGTEIFGVVSAASEVKVGSSHPRKSVADQRTGIESALKAEAALLASNGITTAWVLKKGEAASSKNYIESQSSRISIMLPRTLDITTPPLSIRLERERGDHRAEKINVKLLGNETEAEIRDAIRRAIGTGTKEIEEKSGGGDLENNVGTVESKRLGRRSSDDGQGPIEHALNELVDDSVDATAVRDLPVSQDLRSLWVGNKRVAEIKFEIANLEGDLSEGAKSQVIALRIELIKLIDKEALRINKKLKPASTNGNRADYLRIENELWRLRAEQRVLLMDLLPAYSMTAKSIGFQLDIPGLEIDFTHGPYTGSDIMGFGDVQSFKLSYDPREFRVGSLVRRTFGSKPLELGLDDFRFASQTLLISGSEDGPWLNIFIKGPKGDPNRDEDGPLLMISRDSGRILLYPKGYNADSFSIRDFISGLYTETQQWLHPMMGQWRIADEQRDLRSSADGGGGTRAVEIEWSRSAQPRSTLGLSSDVDSFDDGADWFNQTRFGRRGNVNYAKDPNPDVQENRLARVMLANESGGRVRVNGLDSDGNPTVMLLEGSKTFTLKNEHVFSGEENIPFKWLLGIDYPKVIDIVSNGEVMLALTASGEIHKYDPQKRWFRRIYKIKLYRGEKLPYFSWISLAQLSVIHNVDETVINISGSSYKQVNIDELEKIYPVAQRAILPTPKVVTAPTTRLEEPSDKQGETKELRGELSAINAGRPTINDQVSVRRLRFWNSDNIKAQIKLVIDGENHRSRRSQSSDEGQSISELVGFKVKDGVIYRVLIDGRELPVIVESDIPAENIGRIVKATETKYFILIFTSENFVLGYDSVLGKLILLKDGDGSPIRIDSSRESFNREEQALLLRAAAHFIGSFRMRVNFEHFETQHTAVHEAAHLTVALTLESSFAPTGLTVRRGDKALGDQQGAISDNSWWIENTEGNEFDRMSKKIVDHLEGKDKAAAKETRERVINRIAISLAAHIGTSLAFGSFEYDYGAIGDIHNAWSYALIIADGKVNEGSIGLNRRRRTLTLRDLQNSEFMKEVFLALEEGAERAAGALLENRVLWEKIVCEVSSNQTEEGIWVLSNDKITEIFTTYQAASSQPRSISTADQEYIDSIVEHLMIRFLLEYNVSGADDLTGNTQFRLIEEFNPKLEKYFDALRTRSATAEDHIVKSIILASYFPNNFAAIKLLARYPRPDAVKRMLDLLNDSDLRVGRATEIIIKEAWGDHIFDEFFGRSRVDPGSTGKNSSGGGSDTTGAVDIAWSRSAQPRSTLGLGGPDVDSFDDGADWFNQTRFGRRGNVNYAIDPNPDVQADRDARVLEAKNANSALSDDRAQRIQDMWRKIAPVDTRLAADRNRIEEIDNGSSQLYAGEREQLVQNIWRQKAEADRRLEADKRRVAEIDGATSGTKEITLEANPTDLTAFSGGEQGLIGSLALELVQNALTTKQITEVRVRKTGKHTMPQSPCRFYVLSNGNTKVIFLEDIAPEDRVTLELLTGYGGKFSIPLTEEVFQTGELANLISSTVSTNR